MGSVKKLGRVFNTPFVMLCHARELMRGIVSDRLGNDEKRKKTSARSDAACIPCKRQEWLMVCLQIDEAGKEPFRAGRRREISGFSHEKGEL